MIHIREIQMDVDLPLLVSMNLDRMKDERLPLPDDLEALQILMRSELNAVSKAVFILYQSCTAGYALWDSLPNDHFLRHFYVSNAFRERGVGRSAFRLLKETYWHNLPVRIEVPFNNVQGRQFWERQGFKSCSLVMQHGV